MSHTAPVISVFYIPRNFLSRKSAQKKNTPGPVRKIDTPTVHSVVMDVGLDVKSSTPVVVRNGSIAVTCLS